METNNQSGFFGMLATGSKGCAAAQGRDPYRHQISTCPPITVSDFGPRSCAWGHVQSFPHTSSPGHWTNSLI
jgi:hypothetical protein